MTISPQDEKWMRRALLLARRGEGLTRPNPPVGAVLVRRGRVVGEGFHRKAGGDHAEIGAIRKAGARARGATLYVTLEPCSTWGRTAPCTDAILRAGIRRVVVSVADPNPAHAGRGLRILRRAGLRTAIGVCAREGAELIAPFRCWILSGRPYVTLKMGITLDGRIADARRRSRWITGPEARKRVQELRRRVDAVMVGSGTIAADNPQLLPRPSKGRKPYRVVIDRGARMPLGARVVTDEAVAQSLVVLPAVAVTRREALSRQGVQVLTAPFGKSGTGMRRILRRLGRLGILHVLCEGGGELAAMLIAAGCVDEYRFFVSPKILGGYESVGAVGGRGWSLGHEPQLEFISFERCGPDLMITARPRA